MNHLASDPSRGASPAAGGCADQGGQTFRQKSSLRILVLEDDSLVARQLADDIRRAGDSVLGPFTSLAAATEFEDQADAAILDIRVRRELSFPLADRFQQRRLPYLFYSGLGPEVLPKALKHASLHFKPSPTRQLLADLYNQGRGSDPAVTLTGLLPELRMRARQLMQDHRSADRLLEATLTLAIRDVAECPVNGLEAWLRLRLEQEYRLRHRHHMI